jgi:hypothetical protein
MNYVKVRCALGDAPPGCLIKCRAERRVVVRKLTRRAQRREPGESLFDSIRVGVAVAADI